MGTRRIFCTTAFWTATSPILIRFRPPKLAIHLKTVQKGPFSDGHRPLLPALPTPDLCDLVARQVHWTAWEAHIREHGYTLDRPWGSRHPRFPEIRYPLDYGYLNGTLSTDGEAMDVFVGTARNGLVALLLTADFRRGDREGKLLYNCTPEEVYCVHGFLNFDPRLMQGILVMRYPMHQLWEAGSPTVQPKAPPEG